MTRLLFAAALLVAVPALAQSPTIEVVQPWARATPGSVRSGAVYLTLTDHGVPDSLVGISTPVAGMAMVHETTMENGVAKMRMLDSVALTPHMPVALKPGTMHIMLTGLKQPLKAGDSFPLTLTFAKAAPVTVTVTIMAAGASAPAAAGDAGHDMKDMPGMKMP
jgi:periplasmic copper chaperone A